MKSQRIIANLTGFVAILASFLFCSAAFAESEGPCAGQTNIAASNKLNKLGHREYDRRNFIGAATYYSKAIKLNPRQAGAYSYRGDCYHKLGDSSRAISDYNQALKLEPGDSFVLGLLGEAKLHLDNKQEALADFDAAIKMGPTYYFLFSYRAKLRLENEDYTGAIADCDKALPMCPIASDLYWCRGKAFAALGKLSEAHCDYSKAIQLYPNDPTGYDMRSYLNFKMGNLVGGIGDFFHSRANDFPPLPAALLILLALEIVAFTPAVIEVKSCLR